MSMNHKGEIQTSVISSYAVPHQLVSIQKRYVYGIAGLIAIFEEEGPGGFG